MTLNKMGNFTFNHADQQDDLYKEKTSAEIKASFDSRGNELKTALNGLIDSLNSTTISDATAPVRYALDTGTANAYVITLSPAPTTYFDGMAVSVKIKTDSSATSTLNVNGLGAIPLKRANGSDVTNLKANGIYTFRYNSTTGNFIAQGEGASGNAIASDLLSGKTAGSDAGDIVGTMVNNGGITITPSSSSQPIPAGYHNGSGAVPAVVVPASNVLSGTTIAGTAGTMVNNGAGGTVTPSTSNQTKAAGFWSSLITILGDINLIAANIKAGISIFGVSGKAEVVDTTTASAPTASNILNGKTAFANGTIINGTMPNKVASATVITPSTTDQAIPQGYFGGVVGDGKVVGDVNLTSPNIVSGKTIFGVAGTASSGSPTLTGTAAVSDVLSGKTYYDTDPNTARTGTMTNRGAVTITPTVGSQPIPAGYHNGAGTVNGDANLVSGNIKAGTTIFGVAGATNVVDTTTASAATSADMILAKKAYVNGSLVTGTMPNKVGSTTVITPSTVDQTFPQGYYGGLASDGKVVGDTNLVSGNIVSGKTIFGVAGSATTGNPALTGNATASDVLATKTYYDTDVNTKRTGTMVNNGAVTITPSTLPQTIPAGYHNGSGAVDGDFNLISANIKAGIMIFGVPGATKVIDTTTGTAATASNILSGKTAFANGASISGSMPNKVGSGTVLTPSTADQVIPQGYFGGIAADGKVTGDANLLATNILSGKTIFGVAGSAFVLGPGNDTVLFSTSPGFNYQTKETSMTKLISIQAQTAGKYRVSFNLYSDYGNGVVYAYAKIYVNGVAVGTFRSNSTQTSTTFTEDIQLAANDVLQIYAYTSDPTYNANVSSVKVSIGGLNFTLV